MHLFTCGKWPRYCSEVSPVHLLTERFPSVHLQTACYGEEIPKTEVGARSPERSGLQTSHRKKKRNTFNKPSASRQLVDKSLRYNEVGMDRSRWCVVCSRIFLKDRKRTIENHTTSFKCESSIFILYVYKNRLLQYFSFFRPPRTCE